MRLDDTIVPSLVEKPVKKKGIKDYFPFLRWLPEYDRRDLSGDVIAGFVVAVLLIPQAMAYSNLAGLPPQLGFYSSVIGLTFFAFFTTSRFLSVGPVALVSILIAAGVGNLEPQGSESYVGVAVSLALLVAIIQLLIGIFQLGFIVNFISHPVISGFTSAAAVIIVFSQLEVLFGLTFPYSEKVYVTAIAIYEQIQNTNYLSLSVGVGGILFLAFYPKVTARILKRRKADDWKNEVVIRSAPLLLVIISALIVRSLKLDTSFGLSVVGEISSGLPQFVIPSFANFQRLLPVAFAIAFVGFMESYSISTTLASKRGQKIDPNQDLIALGIANAGTTLFGGYSITGSFSRSSVNFNSGASSQISSIIAAGVVVLALLFLMPFFYYIPHAVLASIIITAVKDLFDAQKLKHIWLYSRADGYSWLVTFFSTLIFDIQIGIIIGALTAITLYVWRTSQPRINEVGRVGSTEHFRSVSRFDVKISPKVLAVRLDENLYFANAKYLEDYLFYRVLETGQIKHLVIILSSVNFIDVSALDTLECLVTEMKALEVEVYLAEIKGQTMDKIKNSDFISQVGEQNIFLTAHEAMKKLGC